MATKVAVRTALLIAYEFDQHGGGDVAPEHHGGRPQPAPLLHQGHEPAHAHREHAPGQCGLHPGGQGPGGVVRAVRHSGRGQRILYMLNTFFFFFSSEKN